MAYYSWLGTVLPTMWRPPFFPSLRPLSDHLLLFLSLGGPGPENGRRDSFASAAAFAAKEGPVLSRVRGLGMQRSRSCQTLLFKKPALLR